VISEAAASKQAEVYGVLAIALHSRPKRARYFFRRSASFMIFRLRRETENRILPASERLHAGLGIRDIILPGEMKTLLNKAIEAKKVSEANLISRREELAAKSIASSIPLN
jgi:hypothetical protein